MKIKHKRIDDDTTPSMVEKPSVGDQIAHVIVVIFCILIAFCSIIPMWHVLMSSLSDGRELMAHEGIAWLPVGKFTLDGYLKIFRDASVLKGYANTILYTVSSTALGFLIATTAGYAISRDTRLKTPMIMVLMITMLFSGGMIPGYLLIKNMHLIDNRWSLILPGLISAYNVIIMRSFFSTIPESLEESARLDGANDVTIFAKIVLPLSKASIATIALFTAVGYWNDYFSSVLYINTKSRWSLQAVLRYMLTNTNQAMQSAGVTVTATTNVTAATIKAASVVVATVPILCVYPFVQKYFVKGVMIGGVKG